MAHYALLDKNNIVIDVITGVDESTIQTDLDGTKIGGSSESWENFYATRPWFQAKDCKRTSYNAKIRGNYASIGYQYFSEFDIFMPPKCHDEATLNSEIAKWECDNVEHKTISL